MIGDLTYKDEKISNTLSEYQPSKEVGDFTRLIKKDYAVGYEILHRSFAEFNDMSLIDRMNVDQQAFNSYVQPKSQNPDEAWRWNGIRPMTRNKLISIAAHMIASMVYPTVFAQNDADEEDKEAANVMRYMIEYNIRNSDYEISFLYGIISALVNPITYMGIEFTEIMQKIKERNESGDIVTKEVIDEVLSGFQIHNPPADEVLIANPYQFYLQKQRFIIRRRFVDYDELEILHGKHDNFDYVNPGVKVLYNEDDAMFYDQKDDELQTLGEEVVYYNRLEDTEVLYINGIYHGNDNIEDNPIKHRDNKNRPKYALAKTGYEPIDEKRFFFYKSAADKLSGDQSLINRMWQMTMDGTFLEVIPAWGVSGDVNVNTNVMFPGGVTNFGKDAKITPLSSGRNLGAGYNAIEKLEQSIDESSQSRTRSGQAEAGGKTAYEIARLEQNARIQLGIFGKMTARLVKDLGELMIDSIIHNQTVAEFEEVLSGETRMKFRTFLLPDQEEKGQKLTRKIIFDKEMIGSAKSKKDWRKEQYKITKDEGGIDADMRIYKVNPYLFSKIKFNIFVDADKFLPKNEAFEKALRLESYDRMIANPFVDQEAVTRDFLVEVLAKGESNKYMKKQPTMPIEAEKGGSTPLVAQAAKGNALVGVMER